MAKVLGLDLGTNSIGWALVDDNSLEDKGVLIFSEGVKRDKNNNTSSKAAERTGFRSARRLNFRRKIRKYQTLLVLAKYEMCPLTIDEVAAWRKSNFKKYPAKPEFLDWLQTDNFGYRHNQAHKAIRKKQGNNPYYFRDKASKEKVSKSDLGRALYHIAQRRGFLSNRLDQSDDNLIKSKKDEIQSLINDESLNKIDLINEIETIFESYEFKEKKKKDCADATETELWNIRDYILKILNNKVKNKDFPTIKESIIEIYKYINKSENLGAVDGNISKLNKAIADAECETLGQYFWMIYQKDRHSADNEIRNNYTSRERHYLIEFEKICKTQGLEGINETKKDPSEKYSGIVKELYKAIFYQRPLKSQKGLIGKCSLEPNRARCSTSRPEFEEFRMYSFINTIKIKTPDDEKLRKLHKPERDKIEYLFFRKSKSQINFNEIAEKLVDKKWNPVYYKSKEAKNAEYIVNYKHNTTVSGCPTIANLSNVFGNDWKNVIFENYTDKNITDRKTKAILKPKTKDEVVADVWHVLSTYTSDEKLKDFAINKLRVDKTTAEKFAKIHLKKDYANLSLYAINKILPYLKMGSLYSHAVFMANMDKLVKPEKWKNEADRIFIEKEVEKIIDNYQEESKVVFVINSLLSNCYNNNDTYSKEAENIYRKDLEKSLKKEFGTKTWEDKENKDELLNNAFEDFITQLKARKRITIKRIDEKIIDFLKGENEHGEIFCEDKDLLKKLYHPSDIEKFSLVKLKDKEGNIIKIEGKEAIGLGSPDVGSIKNPMAIKALHQLKKLINTLIVEGQIDETTKINLELSRQLNDANKRKAIEKWQNDRKELYKVYADKIKELYPKENKGKTIDNLTDTDIEKFAYALEQRKDGKSFVIKKIDKKNELCLIVSEKDVQKYTLWEEQNHICIYTGNTISLSSFLGANPDYDIEHTLPRSKSWDNSQMNKTLCEKGFNRNTKGNKTPFELQMDAEILPRIEHWKVKYEALADEIEKLKRQSRSATDKDQKDRLIQNRHYKKIEHDYWKGKYSRFTMEEIKEGFKNSQGVDIGIISKYSRAYLKAVFKKVYPVKGEMVAEYRKAWGLHDTFKDKLGRTQYLPKDRSNHIHHCIDAVTIASMNKSKYDKLAHAWGLEDKGEFEKAKEELAKEKPWKTFTEDVRNLENEVFIVHQNKDVLPIQTKRLERKRGKIQYVFENTKDEQGRKVPKTDKNGKLIYKLDEKGKRIPKIQQGDAVRGSLHLDTFYGAIKQPELDKDGKFVFDENKNIVLQKDTKTGEEIVSYVVRKELKSLKDSDVKNIVDINIKDIVLKAKEDKLISFSKNGAKVNDTIWQNKEKQIPLKKVRIYTSVKSPLKDFKKHATPFLSRKEYKQQFNVVNEENYCMAIYEGKNEKGKIERAYELVNNIDAGEYYKLSNKKDRKEKNINLVPEKHIETDFPLIYQNSKPFIIKKGISAIILSDNDECVEWENQNWLKNRLYVLSGIDKDGIKLNHNQEARMGTDTIKFMNDIIDKQKLENVIPELLKIKNLSIDSIKEDFVNPEIKRKDFFSSLQKTINDSYKEYNIADNKGKIKTIKLKESSLTTPKGGNVIDNYKSFPYIKFKSSGFYAKIENIDFKITPTGKIAKI
tara:strand:- start:3229 stop:8091 length:4863 start_codon:yes stop_codon:yes gene_type:complete